MSTTIPQELLDYAAALRERVDSWPMFTLPSVTKDIMDKARAYTEGVEWSVANIDKLRELMEGRYWDERSGCDRYERNHIAGERAAAAFLLKSHVPTYMPPTWEWLLADAARRSRALPNLS